MFKSIRVQLNVLLHIGGGKSDRRRNAIDVLFAPVPIGTHIYVGDSGVVIVALRQGSHKIFQFREEDGVIPHGFVLYASFPCYIIEGLAPDRLSAIGKDPAGGNVLISIIRTVGVHDPKGKLLALRLPDLDGIVDRRPVVLTLRRLYAGPVITQIPNAPSSYYACRMIGR